MMSRRCTWNALCRQLPFLMSMLLVLSGCTLTRGASTSLAPTRTQLSAKPSPIGVFFENPLSCDTSLVLATDRLTYDQAEVNQLTAFIGSQGDNLGYLDGPSLPETLRYITGSAPISIFSKDALGGQQVDSTPCFVKMELTNISQEALQIPQVHLRYLSSAKPNTQLYRLINVCSIGPRTQTTCPYFPGAGPGEGYGVRFTIGRGPTNTIYSDKPGSIQPGPMPAIPTLRPGDAAKITIEIDVKNDESGLFVSAIPEVVVTSLNETQIIALTSLKMDIAIAAPQNFSCYALRGDTFVQQEPLISSPQDLGGSWCV